MKLTFHTALQTPAVSRTMTRQFQCCTPLPLCLLILLTAITSGACWIESSTPLLVSQGGDFVRDRALAVYTNDTSSDQVDAVAGDTVDWKFVDIVEPGTLTVAVTLDSPENVKGVITLRDNFAQPLQRFEIAQDRSSYVFRSVETTLDGRYYIHVECFDGSSVYTVGVDFAKIVVGTPTVAGKPFVRFVEEPVRRWKPRKTSPALPKTVDAEDADGETSKKVDAPAAEDALPDGPGLIEIRGTIKRVLALDKGGARVFIAVEGDDYDNIKAGDRGLITGIKRGLKVSRTNGRDVVADTKATAQSIKAKSIVILRVSPKK